MNKEFVPYEEALALKELGFDEPCFKVVEGGPTDIFPYEKLDVPIYQQAFRWFRDNHGFYYQIHKGFGWEGIVRNISKGLIEWHDGTFNTYEEAELECLKKLIKIVEQKEK